MPDNSSNGSKSAVCWYWKSSSAAIKPRFKVQPRRWVIELIFGWLNRYRRLSKDYERATESSEAIIQLAMLRLMLSRFYKKKWLEGTVKQETPLDAESACSLDQAGDLLTKGLAKSSSSIKTSGLRFVDQIVGCDSLVFRRL